PHTVFGAFSVAGGFLLGIGWYHLHKRRRDGIDSVDAAGRVVVGSNPAMGRDATDHKVWLQSLRIGAVVALVSFAGVALTGDLQAKLMFEQQPMKMAAAEAACHDGTGFSVLSVGDIGARDCDDVKAVIELPGLPSFLANGDFNTEVKGVNTLIPEYQEKYGTVLPDGPAYGERAGQPIQYVPVMAVTYWGFRIMITFGMLAAAAALVALWL
ncbi:cytochrome ubiquinol oxidase subunit I, partial [Arthrobacter deserti]|nr:cytochrome ubiquinol oxidase subunit I [Arthrobacter deserti]